MTTLETLQAELERRAQAETERRVKVAIDALYNAGYRWTDKIMLGNSTYSYYEVSTAIADAMRQSIGRIVLREMTEDLLSAVDKINDITGKIQELTE